MSKEHGYYVPKSLNGSGLTPFDKHLLGYIKSLCFYESGKGYCNMFNKTIARDLEVTPHWVSRSISKLKRLGMIRVEIDQAVGNRRKIFVDGKPQKVITGTVDDFNSNNIPIPPQPHTSITPVTDINKVLSKQESKQERSRASPTSLSHELVKFAESFPKIKIDCAFDPQRFDMELLIAKMQEPSDWLVPTAEAQGFAWLLARYESVIAGKYTKTKSPPPRQKKRGLERNYPPGYVGKEIFKNTNLDEVEI